MIRAIVEILVAEQPAPAFVASALPGPLAATVEAAWVANTLITLWASPAVVASATTRHSGSFNALGYDYEKVRNKSKDTDTYHIHL